MLPVGMPIQAGPRHRQYGLYRNPFIIMTRYLFILFFATAPLSLLAQPAPLKSQVDRRVELLSIVFRLAGNEEYNGNQFASYVRDIHQHFDAYKTHPAVAMAQQLAQDNGVGFDAVMSMAIHVEQPPSLRPIMPFARANVDSRWGTANADAFARLLHQFYQDARCQVFFDQHQALYQTAADRFDQVLRKVDVGWYKLYYGTTPAGTFNVVVGVGNGGGNYGPKVILPNGREDVYAIMGTWAADSTGNPTYDESAVLPIIIHEFNHSFVNTLVDKNKAELAAFGPTIFSQVEEPMNRQAYAGWQTMINESLVRASVVRYLLTHEPDGLAARRQLRQEESRAFIWTEQLVDLLGEYESSRTQYPTLSDFMPRITQFFGQVAAGFPAIQKAYDQKRAHVLSVEPLADKTTGVDPALTELTIRFDKPMNPKKISIALSDEGKDHMPLRDVIGFSDDGRSLRLKIALKPDWSYSFRLTDTSFQTPDGYPLVEYTVAFKTGRATSAGNASH